MKLSISSCKKLLVLARCEFRSWRCGKANGIPSEPHVIVVVQMANLGDMICTTPVFHALRRRYPEAKIWVIGNLANKNVLEGNPDIDGFFPFPSSHRAACRLFIQLKPDTALVTSAYFNAVAALYLTGVPLIVAPRIVGGISPYQTGLYRKILRYVRIVEHRMHHYAPREYLRLLEPLGIYADDTTKRLGKAPSVKRIDVPGSLYIGIAPGAGNKLKRWSPKKFAQVANYLVKKYGATVVLIGGEGDLDVVIDLLDGVEHSAAILNMVGKCTMDELKALISKLHLFISSDTGPIYIAEAFGIPTIDIVGPVDEREQPPQGDIHLIIKDEHRTSPTMFVMNDRPTDLYETARQSDAISVAQVTFAIDVLMKKLHNKG